MLSQGLNACHHAVFFQAWLKHGNWNLLKRLTKFYLYIVLNGIFLYTNGWQVSARWTVWVWWKKPMLMTNAAILTSFSLNFEMFFSWGNFCWYIVTEVITVSAIQKPCYEYFEKYIWKDLWWSPFSRPWLEFYNFLFHKKLFYRTPVSSYLCFKVPYFDSYFN